MNRVMTPDTLPVVRRLARAAALAPGVLVPLAAAPALAVPPEGWPAPDPVSTLDMLLVLLGIPLALFVGITLLVYVPSMARGERYTPGLAWRNENEWFGGPRGGLGAADHAEPESVGESDRGGASARW
jgi:hypothetical protein